MMALIVPLLIISRAWNGAAATDTADASVAVLIVTLLHIKDTKQCY